MSCWPPHRFMIATTTDPQFVESLAQPLMTATWETRPTIIA